MATILCPPTHEREWGELRMTLSYSNPVFFFLLKNYCIYYDDGDSPVHRGAGFCVFL